MRIAKRLFCSVLSLVPAYLCHAQDADTTRQDKHLFWAPSYAITIDDFRKPPDSVAIAGMGRMGVNSWSVIQLLRVVDVPRSKRDRRTRLEAVYIAPAFCKDCSSTIGHDSMGYRHDRFFLDVAELCSRKARNDLDSIRAVMKIDNTGSIWLETIVSDADRSMRSIWASYTREVVLTRSEEAYLAWRAVIDKMLEETKDRATRPEDRVRFQRNHPLIQGYITPKARIGDLSP